MGYVKVNTNCGCLANTSTIGYEGLIICSKSDYIGSFSSIDGIGDICLESLCVFDMICLLPLSY